MDETRKTVEALNKESDKARDRVRDIAQNALEKGRDTWEGAKDRGEEAMEDVRERGAEAWDDAQKVVRKYPGQAIGISLLVGTVLGIAITALGKRTKK